MSIETENERLILEAAEAEFLEKGFNGAKTTSIAQKAGVTHAMLHYYYRTKENLFDKVFREKIQMIGSSFESVLEEHLPFEETIRNFIHTHFHFLKQNPHLINFIYNEVLGNKSNRDLLYDSVAPIITKIYKRLGKLVDEEIAKGTIKPIRPLDLLLNIISLNVITFMAFPLLKEYLSDYEEADYEQKLKEREENNVQFILNALRA